jgi:hypothetical protein
MKNIIASLTIGACLLLPSAGGVYAADPHKSATFNNITGTGQPGTINGNSCGPVSAGGVGPGPGGSANGNGSPFNPNPTSPNGITYAGNTGNPTAPGGVGNYPISVSQYDVACFQAP